mmetsp:Transcript_50450/g.151948  ORF Transcript_50450/g.151948 Transcript_50450/m.151948 type:complete len:176 (-) Transcript_50450:2-529(-)
MRLILSYHFANYHSAEKMAVKSRIAQNSLGNHGQVVQTFYDGLAALSRSPRRSLREKRRRMAVARRSLKKMKKFAQLCPENCLHKVFFLKAELAAFLGREEAATRLYGRAIERAGSEGFIHEQALACERAGMHLLSRGEESLAAEQIKDARSLYDCWGAQAKVDQLEERFHSLLK